MLERAKEVTRYQQWTYVEYARFADDLVVLVSGHPRQHWLRDAVSRRLREEFAKLEVEVNNEKSRQVDLARGEEFSFLGFQIRRTRSRKGRWMPLRIPQVKKRTALLRQLKAEFRRLKDPRSTTARRLSTPPRLARLQQTPISFGLSRYIN